MNNAQIEQEMETLLGLRTDSVSQSPLRRPITIRDFAASESSEDDLAALAASPAEAGAAAAERAPLLVERQTTHGNFEDNAIISQAIKDLLRSGPGWLKLSAIERESMDMIALKFSRILSGKSMEKQHWEDVRGYAALVEEKCF